MHHYLKQEKKFKLIKEGKSRFFEQNINQQITSYSCLLFMCLSIVFEVEHLVVLIFVLIDQKLNRLEID